MIIIGLLMLGCNHMREVDVGKFKRLKQCLLACMRA